MQEASSPRTTARPNAASMNEATLEKNAGFQEMRTILDRLCASLLPYLEERFTPQQLAAE